MKIAVPYENGQVFQHFGRSEQFKIYTAENGLLQDAEVIPTNGQGHGALAGFLMQNHVNVVLCGGIGAGAQSALAQAGIQLFGGLSGSTDAAVTKYLAGRLVPAPIPCSGHHSHGDRRLRRKLSLIAPCSNSPGRTRSSFLRFSGQSAACW